MRLLLFSDAHLDQSTAGLRRIDDVAGAFRRVAKLAVEREVDQVCFLGDLSDPDSGSILVHVLDVVMAFVQALTMHEIGSLWIAGNHDTVEDGTGASSLRPLRNYWGEYAPIVAEEPEHFMLGATVEAILLPYVARSRAYDPAEYMRANPFEQNGARIVLGHCTSLRGARLGSESNDLARGGALEFPIEECKRQGVTFMANGHFHHQQLTPSGVHIPGSLERLRFDEEANHPGVLIVDV